MVERSKLEYVLREQDLAASGRVSPGTGAKMGKLTGAEYMVMGTVTAFEEGTKGSITAGKLADFVILAEDPHEADHLGAPARHVRGISVRAQAEHMPFATARRIRPDDLHGRQVDKRDLIGILHRRHGMLTIRMKQDCMRPRIRTEIESSDNSCIDDVDEHDVAARRTVRPIFTRQCVTPVG